MTAVKATEQFINWLTGKPIALFDAPNSAFNPSGSTHSPGLVPDPGSTTNSVRFLREDATWALPTYTINVKDFGAKGDSSTDDTAAIAAAYNSLVARGHGGVIYFPAGDYVFSSFPTLSVPSIIIKGEGRSARNASLLAFGTTLRPTNSTGDDITINEQYIWLEDIAIIPIVRKTSGFAVSFNSVSFQCGMNRVLIQNAYNGINTAGGSEIHINEVHTRSMLGIRGINTFSTTGLFGITIDKYVADNPYPLPYGPVKTWAITTAFTANDIIFNNGNIYQCTTSGTSAGAGTGPSGLPLTGFSAQDAFSELIIDNTVRWKFVANSLTWIVFDSKSFSIRMNNVITINGLHGVLTEDTTNSGITTRPNWVFANNLETDHTLQEGLVLNRGCDFYAVNSWFGSSLTTNGITVATTYTGAVQITTSRIAGNFQHGILVQAGPKVCKFTNNLVQNNSVGGAGSFHGIIIAANATDFVITGNQCGTDPNIGSGNNQGFGIIVLAGTSDRYIIAHNLVSGNISPGVSDGGTGVNKTVASNF